MLCNVGILFYSNSALSHFSWLPFMVRHWECIDIKILPHTRTHTLVLQYTSLLYMRHIYMQLLFLTNTAQLNETESQWNEAKTHYKVIASWTTTPRSLLLKVLITRGRYTCVYSLSCVLHFSRGLKSNIPLTQLRLKCITDSISLTHCCFNNHSMTSDSLTPETR